MILFSIITVCRNDHNGLEQSFKSVIFQTCINYEWIVVDGNSHDGTVEWLSKLNSDMFRWVSEPDKGIFHAMNKGIDMAKGRYLIFLNSFDEFAHENVLKNISLAIEQKNPELIYGDAIDVSPSFTEYYKIAHRPKDLWKGMFTSHQAIVFKNRKGLYYPLEYKYASDYAYIALHLKETPEDRILYLKEAFCKFKLGGCNETLRFHAIKEDYLIRRKVMNLGLSKSIALYLLHFIHTILKKSMPAISRKVRYAYVQRN